MMTRVKTSMLPVELLGLAAPWIVPCEQWDFHVPQSPAIPARSLEEAERSMLLNALQAAGWNQTRAAELLSITRDTLRYRMKKFNLRAAEASASRPE